MSGSRFLLIAAATFSFIGQASAEATPPEGVRVLTGADSAMVRRNRLLPWRPLPAATAVPQGSEVRCDQPCTLKVDADNTIALTPGAIVSVGDFFYVPLVAGAPSLVPAHQVELREGIIEAISPSDRALPLVVSVDAAEHVAIRHARVQISQKDDRMAVGVLSGKARVGASRSWITLEQGQATTVTAHGRPNPAGSVLAPPEWQASQGSCQPALSITEAGQLASVGGCWSAVPRSANYRVEVARDAEFKDSLGATERVDVTSWSRVLPVGRYFVRVGAVDANGLAGQLSTVRPLVVIPCVLPPGAKADMGRHLLVVPEGREVSFGDTSDLELAMDKGGFSRAPKSVRMDGEAEHEIRLRLRSDPASASSMTMTRRALRAEVRMTPRTAKWPTDPVDVSVTIEDPSGQIDPSTVEAHLSAMVGLTELKLNWVHEGAVWSTHVKPRNTGGPTVLRVIAKDEFGTQIGRNFLEIAHSPEHLIVVKPDTQRVANN